MTRLFVTATGTEIGKTFVTAAIAAELRRKHRSLRVLKPIVTGFDPKTLAQSDPGILLKAQGLPPTALNLVSPWRFAAPLSPDMAAAREKRFVDFEALAGFCKATIGGPEDDVLIEGIGGVMVPLDERHTVLDWIAALEIPTLLVAGTYLGTISHTLTAFEMLTRRGVTVAAIVLNESVESPVPPEETAASIARFARRAPIVTMRRGDGGAEDIAAKLMPLI
jgi:dethiobiotin synthetase